MTPGASGLDSLEESSSGFSQGQKSSSSVMRLWSQMFKDCSAGGSTPTVQCSSVKCATCRHHFGNSANNMKHKFVMAEILAALLPVLLHPSLCVNAPVTTHVDSVAALASLVRGNSKSTDLAHAAMIYPGCLPSVGVV